VEAGGSGYDRRHLMVMVLVVVGVGRGVVENLRSL
jgi:hypothetical protein